MWYDIDKKAEAAMRSAVQAIRAAEQSKTEPAWDGEALPAACTVLTAPAATLAGITGRSAAHAGPDRDTATPSQLGTIHALSAASACL
jgi:hypothetical protein